MNSVQLFDFFTREKKKRSPEKQTDVQVPRKGLDKYSNAFQDTTLHLGLFQGVRRRRSSTRAVFQISSSSFAIRSGVKLVISFRKTLDRWGGSGTCLFVAVRGSGPVTAPCSISDFDIRSRCCHLDRPISTPDISTCRGWNHRCIVDLFRLLFFNQHVNNSDA